MKKITLLFMLLFSSIIYSQEKDNYNRLLFNEVKKNKAVTEEVRDFLIDTYSGILTKTKDEDLKTEINDEIKSLNSIKFSSTPARDLSTIDRKILKKYRVIKDDFNKSTTIYDKSYSDGFANLSIYISPKNKMSLRLSTKYHGTDWIFFKYYSVLCGNDKFEFTFPETDRDVKLGNVYESGIIILDFEEINSIRKILNYQGDIKVRFTGDKYADFNLPKVQINRMIDILNLYDLLKEE